MKRIFTSILVLIASILSIHSQTRFQKTYGGTGDEGAWSVIQTSDHGYLLSGYTTSFGAGQRDAYIIKTDSAGVKQWSKTIGGALNDEATMAIEDSGSYVIGGYTNNFGAGGTDGFLARLDLSGNIIWYKTYGSTRVDYQILRFAKTFDNGFIISYSLNAGGGSFKYTLVKTDSNGNMIWSRSYGLNTDVAGAVIQTRDTNYLVSGFSNSYTGLLNYLVMKVNQSGNTLWTKVISSPSTDGGSYCLFEC